MTMSSFDPADVAMDWLEFYRVGSLSIVDLYADEAAFECVCKGEKLLIGQAAIASYWKQRFAKELAGEIYMLQVNEYTTVLSFFVAHKIVQAQFYFDEAGKITWSQCGPTVEIASLMN